MNAKAITCEKIAKVCTPIHFCKDDSRKCIEYAGFGKISLPLKFRPINPDETEQAVVAPGANVSYILREYNGGTKDVCTVLLLYFVGGSTAYQFSHSLCIDIDTAAQIWGMDGYR